MPTCSMIVRLCVGGDAKEDPALPVTKPTKSFMQKKHNNLAYNQCTIKQLMPNKCHGSMDGHAHTLWHVDASRCIASWRAALRGLEAFGIHYLPFTKPASKGTGH